MVALRVRACQRPALVMTTFPNSQGGRLPELRLYYKKINNTLAQPLFCSLNHLFDGILVAIAIMVHLSSLV